MALTSLALLVALGQTSTHHATVEVRIVVVDVVVLDQHGDFVTGLDADDFVINEDGLPVAAESVSEVHHQFDHSAGAAAASATAEAKASPPPVAAAPPPARQFIFFLDASSVSRDKIGRFREATEAAAAWAERSLGPEDRVTILRFDGRAQLIAEDRPYGPEIPDLLRAASLDAEGRWGRPDLAQASARDGDEVQLFDLGEVELAEFDTEPGSDDEASSESLQRRTIRDLLDFERRYRTTRFADTLEWLADRIQHKPGRKAVILLSQGHQMDRTLAGRLRDDVLPRLRSADASLYAISTAGLISPFDMPSAAGARPLRTDLGSWDSESGEFRSTLPGMDRLAAESGGADILTFSALQTGGRVLRDTDAFAVGFERLSQDLAAYYRLSFTPVDRPAGTYHALQITIRDRAELTVRHRPGYVMPEPLDVFLELGGDEADLMAPELVAEPMLVPLPIDGASDLVGVLVRIGSGVLGDEDRGIDLEIQIEVRDLLDNVVSGLVDDLVIEAQSTAAAAIVRDGLEYLADIEVPPMAGEIELRVHDRLDGRTHVSKHTFDVSQRAVASYLLDLVATPVRVRGNVDGAGPEKRLVLGDRVLHPRASGRAAAGETVFMVIDVAATSLSDYDRLDFSIVGPGGTERELADVRWSLEDGGEHGQVLASVTVPVETGRWELRVVGQLGGDRLVVRTPVIVAAAP